MNAYLLSGPTGSGKNSCAEALAQLLDRAAIIDFDAVRAMFTKPHYTPWDGEEGKRQNELTMRMVCSIANEMLTDNRVAIICDVADNNSTAFYRKSIPGIFITQLSPPWETVLERNKRRAEVEGYDRLTQEQLESVYRDQQLFTDHDLLLDNSRQTREETAAEVFRAAQLHEAH